VDLKRKKINGTHTKVKR